MKGAKVGELRCAACGERPAWMTQLEAQKIALEIEVERLKAQLLTKALAR